MAYLGNPPAEAYTNTVKDSFNGDGSTTAFTLSQPSTTNNLRVVVENVIQDPTVAYSCSGTTLTFTSAPPSGTANIYAVHLGPAVMTAVPPTEITNATTYTSALTVQGAFTSPGIDDNADATAMTIDSSENVLVGKTTSSTTSVGFEARSNGQTVATVDGGTALIANRSTSDGDIVKFMKDGTTVGSIKSRSSGGNLQIDTVQSGIDFAGDGYLPMRNGSITDNTLDIGSSSFRYIDLYLSGGVYVGGTGSANYLDDYEEGTWTPAFDSTSTDPVVSYNDQVGRYTKVGDMVTAWFRINTSSVTSQGTGTLRVVGLPFTSSSISNLFGSSAIAFANTWNGGNAPGGGYVNTNSTTLYLMKRNSADARDHLDTGVAANDLYTSSGGNDLIACVIYKTS